MKNVMKKAWEIARKGQKNFGGKVSEYFVEALKIAWALTKKVVKLSLNDIRYKMVIRYDKVGADVDARIWRKYGKVRIYVNQGYGNQIAMFEFDEDENYIGGHEEMDGIDMFAATDTCYVTNQIQKDLHVGTFA